MNSLTRVSLFSALALGSALVATAQDSAHGGLMGRVTDGNRKLNLSGARVTIAAAAQETYTDAAGNYSFFWIKPGAYEVEVSYVGFETLRFVIQIDAGATARHEAAFSSEVVTMEKFVIEGSEIGAARALNNQRASATLSNIVAADEIGRFPDQNAAESLQRIPGLALYRDQGEGRYIVARGIRPDLNAVSLNGVAIASPERGGRVVALDVLPTDALGSVEVTKVLTPDKPADGIGASVDMKSRSAFDSSERQLSASVQGQYSRLADKFSGKLNATYADLFADGTLGLIVSPTYQKREFVSHNFEEDGGWSLKTVPGQASQEYFLNGLAFREYEILRTRYGASAGLEYRPHADARYALRATYSRFNDEENRYITFIPFSEGTISALTASSATVTNLRRERHDLRMREKTQELLVLSAEGSQKFGDWTASGTLAWSEGSEDRPDETAVRFRKSARGSTWSYDFSRGAYAPVVAQTLGTPVSSPAAFNELSRLEVVNAPGSEAEWSAGLNLRRDFRLPGATKSYFKAGFLYRSKDKDQSNEVYDYAPLSGTAFSFPLLAEEQKDYSYYGTHRLSAALVRKHFSSNLAAFSADYNAVDSALETWDSDEDITAAYAMLGSTWGRATLITGVRHEHTKFSSSGNSIVDEEDIVPGSASSSYGNTLPTAILRYDLTPSTIMRASIGRTLARPAFEQSAFMREVNSEDMEITSGNPALKALTSTNYDLSLEQYFKSLGMFSASVFRKDIRNFAYLAPLAEPDAQGYEVTTWLNGPKGNVRGLELAWQLQFHFLPAPLDSFGLMANYTRTDSEGGIPDRPGEKLPFIGQSKNIGNVALTWERSGLFLRAAVNFRSPRLREDEPVGASAVEDRYVDSHVQLDLNASYKLTRDIELFGEVLNVTDEPFRVYFGGPGKHLAQLEKYGWSANAGVRWKL